MIDQIELTILSGRGGSTRAAQSSIRFRFAPDLHTRLVDRASQHQVSMQLLLEQLVRYGLDVLDEQDRRHAGDNPEGTQQS